MFAKYKLGGIDDGKLENEIGLASLSEMRQQDKNTDTATYGAGGFSSILPEVQIHLCDPFQGR